MSHGVDVAGGDDDQAQEAQVSKKKLGKEIVKLLEESKLEWNVDVGTKHYKVKVEGSLVVVVPRSPKDTARRQVNTIATVRRFLRHRKGDKE